MTDKSLVTQGKTLDEAVQRAAIVLHCDKSKVAYEIIQDGMASRAGNPPKPWKLRVCEVSSAPPVDYHQDEWPQAQLPWSAEAMQEMASERFLSELVLHLQPYRGAPPEEHIIVAAGDGKLAKTIHGDVNHVTGSVDCATDVFVKGTVRRSHTVKSGGSIVVDGDVEAATLIARDDIIVLGTMFGAAVSTYGSITCRFAQGAHLTCCNHLAILGTTVHSTLTAGDSIWLGESTVGGTYYAENQISAHMVGQEAGTPAKLIAGHSVRIRSELEAIRTRAGALVQRMRANDTALAALVTKEKSSTSGTVQERTQIWHRSVEQARINSTLVALAKKKAALAQQLEQDNNARIRIMDRIYPGTQIEINGAALEIKQTTQFVALTRDETEAVVRMSSYR